MIYKAQSAFSSRAHSRLSIKVCWMKIFYITAHNHTFWLWVMAILQKRKLRPREGAITQPAGGRTGSRVSSNKFEASAFFL